MKLVIDIADNRAASFMELLKGHSYVKAKSLSATAVLDELAHIKSFQTGRKTQGRENQKSSGIRSIK